MPLLILVPLHTQGAKVDLKPLQAPVLEGTWRPASKHNDLKRVVIQHGKSRWTIQIWAYSTMSAIDWGVRHLTLYGKDVGSNTADYGMATWVDEFADHTVVASRRGDRLRIEIFARFKDGSGRSNYRSVEEFKKGKA